MITFGFQRVGKGKGNDSVVYDKDFQETRISLGEGECKEIVVGLAQYSEVCK